MERPRGEREQSLFEELKDLQYDWSSENRCGDETGEAGSTNGAGGPVAFNLSYSPLLSSTHNGSLLG